MANDGTSTGSSNLIFLTVTDVEEASPTITTVTGKTTKLIGLDIVIPSPVSILVGDKVIFPLIIRNDKNVLLTKVNLKVETSSKELTATLKKTVIPVLNPGQQEIINMEIKSSAVITEDRYGIILSASSAEGASDSAEFFVNVQDFGSANRSVILPRLQAAKELLKNNPTCLELSELLSQAEGALKEKKFEKSKSLIENTIKGCNDLLSFIPEKIETPSRKSRQNLILFIEISS